MKNKTIIIGGLAFLGMGGLAYALSTKKSTGKAGGALLPDTNSTSLATVSTTTTSSGSTDTGTTTPVVVPPVVNNTPFVQYPDGFKWYNANGSVMRNTVKLSLTGAASNILSATVDLPESDGYEISYAIDMGDAGWTKGIPQNITLCADGRVHSLIIGLVHPNGTLKDMHQLFFKVGGTLTIANAIGYPSSFSPKSSNLPLFVEQMPDFYLPNKLNHYAGTKNRKNCAFDFRKRGFVAWELNYEGIDIFDNSLNYQTNYDGWAYSRWQNTSGLNQANRAEIENAAVEFVNADAPIGKGVHTRDDEWRRGVPHDNNGKMNEYYFFKKCKEISPNTHFFCHQGRPYAFPPAFAEGRMSLEEVAFPLRENYTKDQLIDDYVNKNEMGVYWQDIAGQNRGVNAGQFLDISVSGYVGGYNSPWQLYMIAQELLVNKKFYPNAKVCVVIEDNMEVSVSNQLGVFASWQYNNGQNGELEVLNPSLPASYCESVAILANFLGDGINCWGEWGIGQEEHPEIFYSFHSQVGLPEGNTVQGSTAGGYAIKWHGFYDYVDVALWKYSLISNWGQQATLVDISLDAGESWITGDELAPALAGYYKRPMAFAMQANGKTTVLVMYPLNKPTRRYDFRVRVNGTVIPVSVCGQYPEIFTI